MKNPTIVLSSLSVLALAAVGCKEKSDGGGHGAAATSAEFRASFVSLVCDKVFSCGPGNVELLFLGTQERCERYLEQEAASTPSFPRAIRWRFTQNLPLGVWMPSKAC